LACSSDACVLAAKTNPLLTGILERSAGPSLHRFTRLLFLAGYLPVMVW
jgi:hypothetical protein